MTQDGRRGDRGAGLANATRLKGDHELGFDPRRDGAQSEGDRRRLGGADRISVVGGDRHDGD